MKRFNISKIACSIGALATCLVLFSTNFSVYAKTGEEMVAEIKEKAKADEFYTLDKKTFDSNAVNEKVKKYTEAAKKDGFGDICETLSKESVYTWKQCDERWGTKFNLVGTMTDPETNQTVPNTVANSGCKSVSTAILLTLSGTAGENFNPIVFCEFLKDSSNGWTSDSAAGTGWDSQGILREKNAAKWNGDFQPLAFVESSAFDSYDTFLQSLKDAMDAGLYVAPQVNTRNGHYTAAIGYEGNDLILVDPGYDVYGKNPILFSEAKAAGKFDKVNFYLVYYCSNPFKPITSRDSVAVSKGESSKPNSGNDTVQTQGEGANFTYLGLTEWLDEYEIIEKNQLIEAQLELTARDSCSLLEVTEIDSWKGNLQLQKEDGVYKYIRASFMFVGILITIYSVLLFIAFQFDRVNNFIEVNLLCILTFGKLQRAPDENSSTFTPDNPRTRLVTLKDIAGVTIAGVAIGVLLISGKVFSVIQFLMDKIDGIFN